MLLSAAYNSFDDDDRGEIPVFQGDSLHESFCWSGHDILGSAGDRFPFLVFS
jgi:hypothetical protein